MGKKILFIDDDLDMGKLVGLLLNSLDVSFHQAFSGLEGIKKFYEMRPDMVILDVMMPGMDGLDVCRRLREMSNVPILMLTARISDRDMAQGFDAGVDDFLRKPFKNDEFLARVRVLLRRSIQLSTNTSNYMQVYKDSILEVDLNAQTAHLKGKMIDLSPREFTLLAYLVREQKRVISITELTREMQGGLLSGGPANPSVYIHYLRTKIKDGKFGHEYIRTVWGRGYIFEPKPRGTGKLKKI